MDVDVAEHKRNIARSFNRAIESYDAAAHLQYDVGLTLIEMAKSFDFHPERVADIGAGTGILIDHLIKSFSPSDFYLIDMAFSMLLKCKVRAHQHNIICADFDALPIKDQSIDFLFSNMTLQWSLNFEATLKELMRCLQSKGHMVISLLVDDTLQELTKHTSHVNSFYSSCSIESSLKKNCQCIFLDKKTVKITYPRFTDLVKFLKDTGANYSFARSKNHLLERHSIRTQKNITATFDVFYAIVRKS